MNDTENVTDTDLLEQISLQYKTIIQMNRILFQLADVARSRGLVTELFELRDTIDTQENVQYEERPILML